MSKIPHLKKTLSGLCIIVAATLMVTHTNHPHLEVQLFNAVEEKFGDCHLDCAELIIHHSENMDHSYDVEVIYNGLKDDSVYARRIVTTATYKADHWDLQDPHTREYICQSGRGQQEFAASLCL